MPTTTKPILPIKPATSPSKLGPVAAVVKIIALLVGFAGTILSLMAAVGALTENGYARVLVALAVAFVIPLVVADRLLPDDPKRAKGLVSDVVALFWLGFALLFAVVLGNITKGLLTREADRLTASGWVNMARVTYFLAGVAPSIPEPVAASPEPPASGSAGAISDAGSSPDDAGALASDAASDAASAEDAAAEASAPPPTPKGEKTPAELFKQLSPSVVTIFVKGQLEMQGGGTGFLIDSSGTIATNHHVIAGSKQIRIKFQNGAVFDEIELLIDDSSADLALLHVNLEKPVDAGPKVEAEPVTLGDSDKVVVGERAISIGNPLGLEHTLTDGLISSRRLYEGRAWIQMSVPVSPGNSGGPLFNMRGEVIGVTTAQIGAGFGRAQNLNLAVPVNDLKKLIRSEYPQRRKFGESSSSTW
ncbi:MAG: trypsin-like peptidase domain-containing protein [Polyangiaceae bacterium]|nr:trypsin-like peptidase domain-containing protein [Polyangiaceae bacterium]